MTVDRIRLLVTVAAAGLLMSGNASAFETSNSFWPDHVHRCPRPGPDGVPVQCTKVDSSESCGVSSHTSDLYTEGACPEPSVPDDSGGCVFRASRGGGGQRLILGRSVNFPG